MPQKIRGGSVPERTKTKNILASLSALIETDGRDDTRGGGGSLRLKQIRGSGWGGVFWCYNTAQRCNRYLFTPPHRHPLAWTAKDTWPLPPVLAVGPPSEAGKKNKPKRLQPVWKSCSALKVVKTLDSAARLPNSLFKPALIKTNR